MDTLQIAPADAEPTPEQDARSTSSPQVSPFRLAAWQWAIVPLMALAAYAPVLLMWFVGDDFSHLRYNERLPWPLPFTVISSMLFYRPLSTSITWELLPSLFGTNALPYHALSLGLHALAAWMLARVLAVISGEARLGWIAGALFAVYPLSTEPVAWLASQWDEWAAVCLLGAIWGYSLFLKNGNKRGMALGLLSAFAGVFMKESILPLPLLLPFVALVLEFGAKGVYLPSLADLLRAARKGIVAALPFALPSLLFVCLRLGTGGIGGYSAAATDYQHFFWDALVSAGQQYLLPLNRPLYPRTFVQVAGLATGLLFLAGLAAWGRRRLLLLGFALLWTLLFLLPVINLVQVSNPDTLGNRVLYLSLMGVCTGIAALAVGALEDMRFALPARALMLAGLLVIVPVTWVQLGPWVQSSRQTRHIVDEMGKIITPAPNLMLGLNVQDLPRSYKGSYVFWNGLDDAMAVFYKQYVEVRTNTRDGGAWPGGTPAGVYNIAFSEGSDNLFHVTKAGGQLSASLLAPGGQHTWDFSHCKEPLTALQADGAALVCAGTPDAPPRPGTTYARFAPQSPDGKLIFNDAATDTQGYSWLRLAVCARYRGAEGSLGEWFWLSGNASWDAAHSRGFVLDSSGAWRIYVTYVPAEQLNGKVTALRLDPTNTTQPVDIQWVSVEGIP